MSTQPDTAMRHVADEIEAEVPVTERRRPDHSTMQILEALELSEAELMASTAKLSVADQALKAAQQREEHLLKILEKGQKRIQRLLVAAATAGFVVIALLAIILTFLLKTHTH